MSANRRNCAMVGPAPKVAAAVPTMQAAQLTNVLQQGLAGSGAAHTGRDVRIDSLRLKLPASMPPNEVARAVSRALDQAARRRR